MSNTPAILFDENKDYQDNLLKSIIIDQYIFSNLNETIKQLIFKFKLIEMHRFMNQFHAWR